MHLLQVPPGVPRGEIHRFEMVDLSPQKYDLDFMKYPYHGKNMGNMSCFKDLLMVFDAF